MSRYKSDNSILTTEKRAGLYYVYLETSDARTYEATKDIALRKMKKRTKAPNKEDRK